MGKLELSYTPYYILYVKQRTNKDLPYSTENSSLYSVMTYMGKESNLKVIYIRSDQIRSVAQSCPTLCNPMNCSTPGLPVHHQLPEFTQTHVHRVCDAIQPSHPLSSPSPPAPNPSQHQSLSNELTLHMKWPKYCSFSFSIIPSKEHPGLISFRMDWLDLLAVQGTFRSFTVQSVINVLRLFLCFGFHNVNGKDSIY